MIEITRITPQNLPLLDRIAPEVFDGEMDGNALGRFSFSKAQTFIVAHDQGSVIGQIRGVRIHHPDGPQELYIENLGVTPARQRQGIATALVKSLMADAKAKGCKTFYIMAEADNAAACAFYQAQGWSETQTTMFDGKL